MVSTKEFPSLVQRCGESARQTARVARASGPRQARVWRDGVAHSCPRSPSLVEKRPDRPYGPARISTGFWGGFGAPGGFEMRALVGASVFCQYVSVEVLMMLTFPPSQLAT